MAGKPGEPNDHGHEPDARREQEGQPVGADERLGPVAIARHVKADGRALILYTVCPQSQA
jgi:hypothetical protein